jgi:hypothetical protein
VKQWIGALSICYLGYAVLLGVLAMRVFILIREKLSLPTIHGEPARLSFLPPFLIVLAVILPLFFAASVCVSWFLRMRRHRSAVLVLAAVLCLSIPLGTILGAFTIYVMSRSSSRSEFATHAIPTI